MNWTANNGHTAYTTILEMELIEGVGEADALVVATGGAGFGETSPAEAVDVNGAVRVQDITDPPDTTTERLYNNGGNLFWNGTQLDAAPVTPTLQAVTDQGATTTSGITVANINTGQGATEVYAMDQNVRTTDAVTFASASVGTLNTGQGANELYDMDQNVLTTSDVNFNSVSSDTISEKTPDAGITADGVLLKDSSVSAATVDTGQGANELYDMDQNVLTTSDVSFNSVSSDTISEKTADAGVTIDGVKAKDGFVEMATSGVPSPTTNRLYQSSGNLYWNGTQLDAAMSVDKNQINNVGTLGFDWADSEVADSLTVQGGSVNNDSFSAYSDLSAESKIGTGAAQVAAGDHGHTLSALSGAVTDAQVPDDITITEADTLDSVTGRGAATTNGISVATVDTGHGANELYAMDQDVESSDAVSFAQTVLTGATVALDQSNYGEGSNVLINVY